MSIASPPPAGPLRESAKPIKAGAAASGADQLIDARITEACKALWWAEVTRSVLRLALAAVGVMLVWVIIDQWIYSPGTGWRLALFAGLSLGFVWYVLRRIIPLLGSSIRPEYAARSLERDLPELRQSLTSYVTLRGDRENSGLRSRVVRSIGAATAGQLRVHDALPVEATGTIRWWVATACALALMVAYAVISPKNTFQSAARLAAPLAKIDPARRVSIREVLPGDIEAIAGRTVQVSALIDGMRSDEEAFCRWELASGKQQIVLGKEPESRKHSGGLWLPHSASGDVEYSIAAGDAVVGPFRLRVQDVPVVALQSVHYEPPKYTGQSPHTSSSGAITALDGTRVTLLATTNRAVAKAKIEFNPRPLGDLIQATAGATEMEIDAQGTSLSISFPLRSARGRSAAVELESYRIQVSDDSGQSNPEPIIYPIRVVADLPPEVSITMPLRSPQNVPIDAQQIIEVHASDPDFGLKQVRLELRSGIDLIAEPILWSDPQGARGNRVTEYRFRPTEHGLRIGDTVQVTAVATDNRVIEHDTSVEPNRTATDPVELKIVASEPLPDEGDPNAGGLSSPDQRPASDQPQDQPSSKDQNGQQGQNEGGQAQSASGSGKQQSGDSKSATGQTGDGQSAEGESGAGDSSQKGGGKAGSGKQEASDDDSSMGKEGQSSSGAGSSEQDGRQNSGNASESGEPSSGDTRADQGDSNRSSDASKAGGNDPTSRNAEDGKTPDDGSGDASSSGEQTASDSARPGDGKGSRGASGKSPNRAPENGDPSRSDDGSTGGDDGWSGRPTDGSQASGLDGDNEPSGSEPPKHDGETFERIRDYLDQKRNEQQGGRSGAENGSGDSTKNESGTGSKSNPSDKPNEPRDADSSGGGQSRDSDANDATQQGDSADQSQQQSADRTGEKPGQQQDASGSGSKGTESSKDNGSGPSQSEKNGEGQSQSESGQQAKGREPNGDNSDDPSGGEGSRDEAGKQGKAKDDSGAKSGDRGAKSGDRGSSSDGKPSDGQSGDGQSGGEQSPGKTDSDTKAGDRSSDDPAAGEKKSQGGDPKSQPADPNADGSRSTSNSTSGTGAGSEGAGEAGDAPMPPDPVNLEYAKQATDMVLDYLDQTRDAPDRELLDKLKWTEEDLKRFADRWQKVRELEQAGQPTTDGNRDVKEALESLGLRPSSGTTGKVRESADSLRAIRDAGNRKPPPAAYRDAFDAFRRAVGRP